MAGLDTSEIRRVFDLAVKIENPINLSIGQPDFPVPEAVKEAFIKAIRDNHSGYTPTMGLLSLREAISKKWEQKNKISIDPDNILVSTGVASILFFLFQATVNEGDDILLIDPYFLIYPALVKYHKANLHTIPETFSQEELDALLKKGIRPKLIVYATPSNPTGRILQKEQLQRLVSFAQNTKAILVSDEIYESYDYENRFISTARLYPQGTLTLSGFSKSHAMTGIRLGYIGAPPELKDIVSKMATLQQYSVVCAPHPAQVAGITALECPIAEQLEFMKKRRNMVADFLKAFTEFPRPDGAFYIFPKIPVNSREFIEEAIAERLLLVPGYIFGQDPNFVRISYAQKEETLKEGLEIFKKIFNKFNDRV